jgi:uncharacterized protein with von Willebrand factor type A (vWA) domain
MDIIVLLDESGSMESMQMEPVQALNAFIQDQKSIPGKLTLLTFSHVITKHIDHVDIQTVDKFEKYKPCGMTSLYDAICISINENIDSKNIQLVVITDGDDTSSKLHSFEETQALIKKMETENGWKVSFLASGLGIDSGRNLGVKLTPFNNNSQNGQPGSIQIAMRQMSRAISTQRQI